MMNKVSVKTKSQILFSYINKKITIRISKKWLKNIEKELSVKKPT